LDGENLLLLLLLLRDLCEGLLLMMLECVFAGGHGR
jgi:hypothetical protein